MNLLRSAARRISTLILLRSAARKTSGFPRSRAAALWKKPDKNFLTCEHDENFYLTFSALLTAFVDIISQFHKNSNDFWYLNHTFSNDFLISCDSSLNLHTVNYHPHAKNNRLSKNSGNLSAHSIYCKHKQAIV